MTELVNLSPEEWTAVRLSLRVATVAMLASLPVALAVAYLLARGRFPGKSILDNIDVNGTAIGKPGSAG